MINKSILLLVIPALLTLPAGMARADNIHVQTDDQQVTLDRHHGIRIESGDREIIIPERSPASRRSWILSLPRLKKPLQCQGREHHQNTQTRTSGSMSHSHSSVSTRVCQ